MLDIRNRYRTHYGTLLRLGLPLVVGQVGTIVLGFADTLMVGHHSVRELAAASFVNTIVAIILVLALGFSYGLTPLIGHQYGRGENGNIGTILKNGSLAKTCGLGKNLGQSKKKELLVYDASEHGSELFYFGIK